MTQDKFDLMIGRLDRILSEMIAAAQIVNSNTLEMTIMDSMNTQTLKHHAEDMIGAGKKILELIIKG